MSQTKITCKHNKAEQQYICLESQCLQTSEFKLNCFKCLQEVHHHKDFLEHVDKILVDAQVNQKKFDEMINENLQFCQNINCNLEKNIEEMKQKFNQWLDQQSKGFLEQIQKYQLILNEQKEKIQTTKLTEEEIKNIVQFKLLDSELYLRQNKVIQTILQSNETTFSHYFAIQYDNVCKNYQCNVIAKEDLPLLSQIQLINHEFILEKCKQVGCCDSLKNIICIEKECLQNNNLSLECPMCIVVSHGNKPAQHKQQHFKNVKQLQDLQNIYISELEIFCDKKGQEICQESEQLQTVVMEYQKAIEQKLTLFKQFIQEREKEILSYLQKFKSQYNKEGKFQIRRELLLQTDFSVIADIVQLEKNYKQIINQFKQIYTKEKELSQQEFQDLWFKGMAFLQKDKICYLTEKFINPVSSHIQELNDKIIRITAENYNLTSLKNENQQEIEELKKIVEAKTLESDQLIKIEKIIEQNFQAQSKDSKALLEKIIEIVSNFQNNNSKSTLTYKPSNDQIEQKRS